MAVAAGATALGGLSGAISGIAAEKQNEAIRDSQKSAFAAAVEARRQSSQRAGLELAKQRSQATVLSGSTRALAAERGLGGGQTELALLNQISFDQALNSDIIRDNAANRQRAEASRFKAQFEQFEGQVQNVLLQALMGGAQGAAAGASLGSLAAGFGGTAPLAGEVGSTLAGPPTSLSSATAVSPQAAISTGAIQSNTAFFDIAFGVPIL